MLPLLLAAVLAVAAPAHPSPCEEGCVEGGCWVLVYRYSYTEDNGRRIVRETFDGRNYPSEEAAYCAAAEARQTGVKLPTLMRYGRDSNVIPEAITPMPALLTLELGIKPAHPEDSR